MRGTANYVNSQTRNADDLTPERRDGVAEPFPTANAAWAVRARHSRLSARMLTKRLRHLTLADIERLKRTESARAGLSNLSQPQWATPVRTDAGLWQM